MSYSLIVVDMQKVFSASTNKDTLAACKREIKKAMDKRAAILFVEYKGYDKTLSELTKLTKKYDRKYTVIKANNGGGEEVKAALIKNKLPKTRIKVCGVNTDYCVLETVAGLTQTLKSAQVQILSKACNSSNNHERGLARLKLVPRVRVIK